MADDGGDSLPHVSKVRRARGPGRVNLIGDHTDYNLGLALPMAIGLFAEVSFAASDSPSMVVTSTAFDQPIELAVDPTRRGSGTARGDTISKLQPAWGRLIAAMIALCRPRSGGTLRIDSTVPVGSGLSSSAAVAVALAELFATPGPAVEVARLCQEAEHLAGVPVGIMDPLVCAGGRTGHALLVDFDTLATQDVALPLDVEVLVIDSGQPRTLGASGYATRVAECVAASRVIGPLGLASGQSLSSLTDPRLKRRARHVVTECLRTRECAVALDEGRVVEAGALMTESHRSLARDFEVSTPALDDLVEDLLSRPGVLGARMTGAGFGGAVVALARPGALDPSAIPLRAWLVEAVDGTVAARR
jgi:galactokinase